MKIEIRQLLKREHFSLCEAIPPPQGETEARVPSQFELWIKVKHCYENLLTFYSLNLRNIWQVVIPIFP